MLLLFSGQIFALIPGLLSFAAALLLLLAQWKVPEIRRSRILRGVIVVVALFLVVAGILLLYLSEVWSIVK